MKKGRKNLYVAKSRVDGMRGREPADHEKRGEREFTTETQRTLSEEREEKSLCINLLCALCASVV